MLPNPAFYFCHILLSIWSYRPLPSTKNFNSLGLYCAFLLTTDLVVEEKQFFMSTFWLKTSFKDSYVHFSLCYRHGKIVSLQIILTWCHTYELHHLFKKLYKKIKLKSNCFHFNWTCHAIAIFKVKKLIFCHSKQITLKSSSYNDDS